MKKNVSNKNESKHHNITGKNTLGIFAFNHSYEVIIKLVKKIGF